MGLPAVEIELSEGTLVTLSGDNDGVAGMALTGVATGNIQLSEPKQIFSTEEANALGLDEDYDTTNATNVYKNIKDFYSLAGEGAVLWIMIYAKTTLMTTVVDSASNLLSKLLDAASGTIRILAVGRVADDQYAPSYTDGVDPDVLSAISKLDQLAIEYRAKYAPFRAIIDAREFQGATAALIDLTQNTNKNVQATITTDVGGSKNAAIGLLLGKYANIPVQRNPGRVKDGDLGVSASYLTDGSTAIEDMTTGEQDQLHDKGFVFMRRHIGKNGYFFNDDPTATSTADNYASFAIGRVMDKAYVLAYNTFLEELLDDIEVDENGYIDPAIAKSYQSNIEDAVNLSMTNEEEISSVSATIDPQQDVLSTNQIKMEIDVTPKFYSKKIKLILNVDNPAS